MFEVRGQARSRPAFLSPDGGVLWALPSYCLVASRSVRALVALVAVTAVWGVTFVQVKDAIELYPLFAFLAVRFAIAAATLALPARDRIRGLGQGGLVAGVVLGLLVAAAFGLQTAGLERTTVSSTGFITGLYVVLTPLFALLLFRQRVGLAVWLGVALAIVGLALLSGIDAGSATGDLLVLASAVATALQILMVERYATRFDALGLTFVEMASAFVGFLLIALALGDLDVPRGWTVWGALLVTGIFSSALGYLIQIWAQQRISATRIALVFSLEAVWAGLFGYLLADDRLGLTGWGGCALILAGIIVAEPAAAEVLRLSAGGRRRRSR
jgi:drug/metabolite transporter (DMT)-like permease